MGLRASDIMQRKVRSVGPRTSLEDLERAFCEARQGGFPVVDERDRLVGVVSRTDVVRKLATEQSYAEYASDYYRELTAYGEGGPDEAMEAIAARVGARLAGVHVEDVMSHAPVTVSPEVPVRELAQMLTEKAIHRVPVVESGKLVGIVTSTDLVRLLADGRVA
jgi:CBS-domain-containing membrane protein